MTKKFGNDGKTEHFYIVY